MPRLYTQIDQLDNVGGSYYVPRFDGGLNTTNVNEILQDNESIIRKNWGQSQVGAVEKVNGFTKTNATLMGAKPVRGLFRVYESDETTKLLAMCNGKLFYSDDDGTSFTQEGNTTVFTETSFFTGVNYSDLFFFTGLTDNLHIFDPSDNIKRTKCSPAS